MAACTGRNQWGQLCLELAVDIQPVPRRHRAKKPSRPDFIQFEFVFDQVTTFLKPSSLSTPDLVAHIARNPGDSEACIELIARYRKVFFKQAQDAHTIGYEVDVLAHELASHLIKRIPKYTPVPGVTFGLWARGVVYREKVQIVRAYGRQFTTRTKATDVHEETHVTDDENVEETAGINLFLESLKPNELALLDELKVKGHAQTFNNIQLAVIQRLQELAVQFFGGGAMRFFGADDEN